jgi:RNA polymerase sigma factor (sigma-70 family)
MAAKGRVMQDDPLVIALVIRATGGDEDAWQELVDRYAPLVWSICLRYQLDRVDTDDVCQTVWLLLVERIGHLREPAAVPGWLATTTARECLRVIRVARRHDHAGLPPEEKLPPDVDAQMIDEAVIAAERNAAFRAAFADLPESCRTLLSLLMSEPPRSFVEIGDTLGLAVGSIGPMRARCLDRLRRSPQLRMLTEPGDEPHA